MRTFVPLCCFILTAACFAADRPLLDRLTVHATGPVTISLPLDDAPQKPIYRAENGTWLQLQVNAEPGRVTFSLPAPGAGGTTVILRVPDWLVLDDDAAPEIQRLVVDERPVEPLAASRPCEVDLGHRTQPPKQVTVLVHDAANPIDVGAARISLDGAPIAADSIRGVPARDGDETRFIEVALPDMPEGPHALSIRIPDAAAIAHFAELALRFHSGPLVKDGGFEQLSADGAPLQWQIASWDGTGAQFETKIVEGGRNGGHCAQITGIGGHLNLLLYQKLPLTPGRKYVVRGYYQATNASGFLSIINDSQDENKQYDSMPSLKPATDWTPFEFRFTAKPSTGYTLYLRNSGKGSVRWDEVEVEEIGD